MLSLGVYTGPHDPGACLIADGSVVTAIEEERLTRVKYGAIRNYHGLWEEFGERFGYYPWASISYCLQARSIGLDDVDQIVIADDYLAPMAGLNLPVRDPERLVVAREPSGSVHHYVHALSAFWASGFEEAAVLVVDGDGTWTEEGYEAETAYTFTRTGRHSTILKNRYAPVRTDFGAENLFNPGLGWMYEYITTFLGFYNTRAGVPDAGKTMGLAPYGGPRPELAGEWFHLGEGRFDFRPFLDWIVGMGYAEFLNDQSFSLVPDSANISSFAKDLAWKVQSELERGMLGLCGEVQRRTGQRNLCIAGGVGLNAVANGVLARSGIFDRIFVQPAAGDNGQAVGLAYYGYVNAGKARDLKPISHSYTGRGYDTTAIVEYLDAVGASYEVIDTDGLTDRTAAELAQGAVIGWFQGGSEYGPRALGHRSILADPRPEDMRDRINQQVKMREMFRPFAPSVLESHVNKVFDTSTAADTRFMLSCCPVREEWQQMVPAICHVDGTARIQIVAPDVDEQYHRLIASFFETTGVPLVLNTSLNIRGMPLVETPADAIQCLLSSDLDALYIHNIRVVYPEHERIRPDLAPGWTVAENEGRSVLTNGERTLSVTEEEARLLCRFDGARSLRDAVEAAGLKPDSEPPERIAERLVKYAYRAGAVTLRAGRLPFETRWTFGRLPLADGARRHTPYPGPVGPDKLILPRSVGR
ncbi:carbamoyltransferase C-terminal domain-containing protein (plasmid) [Streptomyces sp. BB1-1-1]|uniref:carbamoyltransferase family protein n=1 Tax=Streptomyces sp. BB1-1-1 TaxID=3074430 RepID=UPI0028774A80|nr:carbamoyltransferase C-terminal domain-containing protein [Streptomyces sp. BB1-1-1]WND32867.1 carbamoyltransferase C-terminal domain-containing protein [Streptomyces sp. BB1-1-1]WND40064.1 carbamoyltransferase C-terminal domain-containing protein [Streptomyces sp. BB1-1-1]WND40899.1 carbamoyltransferase C-terminal domain-containing protein [Streptomyces sp. BB1-1-1]